MGIGLPAYILQCLGYIQLIEINIPGKMREKQITSAIL